MDMRKYLTGLLVLVSLVTSSIAHAALSYMTKDEVLRVWGKAEIGDVEKLTAALTPAIKTVVLQSPDGSNWSLARDLGKQIEERKLTTVAHGACNTFTCAMMFLSGAQRMFSGNGRPEIHYVMLSFWEPNTGSNQAITSDRSTMDDVLTWWSSHTRLSGSDLRVHHESMFYSRGGSFRYDHKVFFPAEAKVTPATALHCSGEKEEKLGRGQYFSECMPVKEASALSKGIVTTDERFKLPDLAIPADIQAPAATGFAKLEAPISLMLNDKCKESYALFLTLDAPRAFVVSNNGACWMRNGLSPRPYYYAMEACKKAENAGECRFYAVDDQVVFVPFDQQAPKVSAKQASSTAKPAFIPDPMPANIVLTPDNAKLVLAKNFSRENGLKDITDTFTLEGKIFLHNTIRWEPKDVAIGKQRFEARWFIGDKLVNTSSFNGNMSKSPYTVWFQPTAIEIGEGSGRVELYINGNFLGSKAFTIQAN